MKKVLLSLVAFLMVFNTINAEEVEVLENDKEVTETVLTTNVEETNTTDTSNDVKEETEEYEWAAIQPGSTTTSDGIKVDYDYKGKFKDENKKSYFLFTLVYTIPEDYKEETLVINPDIFEVIGWTQDEGKAPYILPSYTLKINITIINNSKYNYDYDKNSFVVYPYTADELEEIGYKRLPSDQKLFNGEDVTELQQYVRTNNEALKALGLKSKDMSNENIDKKLKELNYTGIEDLAKYYLDFFNDFYGYGKNGKDKVTKLSDFTIEEIAKGIFGGYTTNYKEDNTELIALHFDFLYNYAMGLSLDNEEINDKNQNEYNIGDYMREETKGDKKIEENIGNLETKTEKDIDMNFHFSGPLLGNTYQRYKLTGHAHLSYTAEKGKVIAKYIDVKGNVISEDIITTGMVNNDYRTNAKSFKDYELIKVEGSETGLYTSEDIVVTYIYEFVGGTGGDDVPNTGINTNNALEVTTALSMITLVSAIILRKRFN